MPLTELDMNVLREIARLYVLTREMVQLRCCADHASGRGARKRLGRLGKAGYIVKHRVPVALPGTNGAAPVYYVTKKGAEALASYFEDDAYLATNTRTPRADRLCHWIAINRVRMLIEDAAEHVPGLTVSPWYTEWTVCNQSDSKTDQFYLHTQFSDSPPLSCSPDAAFLLNYRGVSRAYYVEVDLGTSSPRQIAARKSKGYERLATTKSHRKHFPEATSSSLRVLFITINDYRARKTMEEMSDKPANDLWLMMNESQLTQENFFTGDVALDHAGVIGPLLHITTDVVEATQQLIEPHAATPLTA